MNPPPSSPERRHPLITVLTGAGVSTDSGIPDFRGPNGLWTKNPGTEKLFDIDAYLGDPEVRHRSWLARRQNPAWGAEPNAAHRALVDLERRGHLRALVTQNIDRLHQKAGSSPELVLELHGNMVEAVCVSCGARSRTQDALARVDEGDADPRCLVCGGILKTATVMFGQALDPDVLNAAVEAAMDADAFVAVGTSLMVHPAAGLCDVAVRNGARLVIVNADPTPYDDRAAEVVREPIGEALPALLERLAP
ncbi:Sir2 family NAD-dependent protein deacetylase [Aquihabitans sp. G128]|uniref:SIR2 family NAD-dependent protein deacylase n=1 Tax=Aquihabitans sp. G128 TaxID=2849779 RepID=UPI001C2491EB|nr:Sir2 family NAD-dependent protein deacetylase [Aquihabitans sp. G128]QXC60035.1 Sir2 family NAD-dependent protein deacetylase [Aquihabitans sp. G128]